MGLLKLGSKLKSKMSLGSGNFEVASDLKDMFKTSKREPSQTSQTSQTSQKSNLKAQTSRSFSDTKKRNPQKAMDDFYAEVERNQHRYSESSTRPSEEGAYKAYYSKRPVDIEVDAFVDDSADLGLHEAAAAGDTKAMQRELLMGARLEAEDAAGCTALHHAVRSGKVDAVEMLLEAGADANARDLEDNRPLHGISNWLDMEPDVEIVVALCRYGADLHAQNITGWTALHEAATTDQETVVRHLLMLGASVHTKTREGDTALHKAARWNRLDTVRTLLTAGSDADAVDNLGRRPSDRTIDPEVRELLEQHQSARYSRPQNAGRPESSERPRSHTERPQRAEEASSSWAPPSRPTSAQARMHKQSSLADMWETYEARWKAFASATDGSSSVGYNDVPFPARDAETSLDVMLYGTTDDESKRKRLRKELLRWHPDKFLGCCSSRLRSSDQERIMGQVKEMVQMLHNAIKNYS